MKHIFIINPVAGGANSVDALEERIKCCLKPGEYEIYQTKCAGDATAYTKQRCEEADGEEIRFYACGGDGTLHEVANGVIGFDNAQLAAVPGGSGNDFVKYYGGKECFDDLAASVYGIPHRIDALKVTDDKMTKYCINVDNFGFDAYVCDTKNGLSSNKFFKGTPGYIAGVVMGLINAMKTRVQIKADGEVMDDENLIQLATVANCHYVGGMFKAAPNAKNDDGLIDVTIIKPLTRPQFIKLVLPYAKGELFTNPIFEKVRIYKRAKKVEITAPGEFINCIDGEIVNHNHFTVEVVPGAINFVIPTSATLNKPE